jgi:hypothetical protein
VDYRPLTRSEMLADMLRASVASFQVDASERRG